MELEPLRHYSYRAKVIHFMFGKSIVQKGLVAGLLLCFSAVWSHGQRITPDAPVKNFKLPMFGPDGYKIWDLRGREGRYVSAEQIDVVGMILRTWGGGEAQQLELTIESTQASINPKANSAAGSDYIYIREAGNNYSIVGRKWTWEGKTDRITVSEEVRVTFNQSLGGVLK